MWLNDPCPPFLSAALLYQPESVSLIVSAPNLKVKMKIIFFTWFLSHFSLVSLWPAQSIPNPYLSIQGHPWPYVMLFYRSCFLSHPKPSLALWAFTGCSNDLCSSHFQSHCTPWQKCLSSLSTKISPIYLVTHFENMAPPFPEAPQRCKHTVRLYVIYLWILPYSELLESEENIPITVFNIQ